MPDPASFATLSPGALVLARPWIKAVPLGGLGRIGGNMMAYETAEHLFVVDCGVNFPDPDQPGVDWVIPDTTYITSRAEKLRGYVITHAHEDHLGALPYVLPQLDAPVYGTEFTLAILSAKLEEHRVEATLRPLRDGDTFSLGDMAIEVIPVTHSIPGAVALAIHHAVGTLVHTGDFKLDPEPFDGRVTDTERLAALGETGVLALLSDSTNAERAGRTTSEREVALALEPLIATAPRRVLLTTFASNVHRLQAVIEASHRAGRKVAIVGRSMNQFVDIAYERGMLSIPHATLIPPQMVASLAPERVTIIASGCQGEEQSAFGRIAASEHGLITLSAGDRVIHSARRIPGNERLIGRALNRLMARGVEVIDERSGLCIHTSGHAYSGEQEEMLALCRPRFFVPLHGELRHMRRHAQLAAHMGAQPFVLETGLPIELALTDDGPTATIVDPVPAGEVLVDGGEPVPPIVLRDRRLLAASGMVVATVVMDDLRVRRAPVALTTRGVVYVDENALLLERAARLAESAFDACGADASDEERQEAVRLSMRRFFRRELGRRPVIVATLVRVDS